MKNVDSLGRDYGQQRRLDARRRDAVQFSREVAHFRPFDLASILLEIGLWFTCALPQIIYHPT